jgi:hypothetical protein
MPSKSDNLHDTDTIEEQRDGKAGFLFLAKNVTALFDIFCLGKGRGQAGKVSDE